MGRRRATVAVATALVLGAAGLPAALAPASAAPVGQGFTVTPSDLAYILKQIKIAEAHVANTTPATGPCGALLGTGPNQIPNPLLSYGLRTVDGSCNNLQPNRAQFGASGQVFPRHASASFRPAEDGAPVGQTGQTSYATKNTNVVDSQPRLISNLIVDQTAANPAAVAAATAPIRTQGSAGVTPCETPGVPAGCVPKGQTLDIPNVTTDVGLSPPFNAWFTLFGQFFDHGLDFTKKSHGAVIVPLRSDDPLLDGLDGIPGNADDPGPDERFMVLTRTENQPGPDGVLGTADDVKEGTNTDSPFVDQSQTYASHPTHQVFLRAYADNADGDPVSTGKLLSTADGGLSPWSLVKSAAAADLGLRLVDRDVLDIPMLATDPYGRFLPGPNGLPQWVTAGPDGVALTGDDGLLEGDRTNPVPAPADVNRIGIAFLDDIAHFAVPQQATPDQGPGRPARPALMPDSNSTITGAGGTQPAGTYDDEMLDAHFLAGDGRSNENIGLTAIHQVFHSEHDRLVDDIKTTLTTDTSAKGVAALPEWQSALGADGWNGERLFQAARFVTEMEYQHLAFEEFARKVQPAISPFAAYHDNINSAIRAEFAHAVYRFGHSMLTDTISRTNEDGTPNDVSLFDGFLNPPAFHDGGSAGRLTAPQAVGAIAMGMADQVGNEIDEFVTNTLRNNVLGLPLDLATINLARARDAGVPTLNAFRRELHAKTRDSQLTPYGSWLEFGLQLKHPQSLVNFIAAYGAHPSVLAADTIAAKREAAQLLVDPPLGTDPARVPPDAEAFITASGAWANAANGISTSGVDDIDLWVGGLAERTNLFGGLLGSTFNVVFESQMLDLQNGDRFYYLARTPGMALLSSLEGNSFAEMVMRNSTAHTLKADSFGTADCKFQLSRLDGTAAAFQTQGITVADDPTSECDERKLLVRRPDGTIQYRTSNTVDPSGINGQGVYNGTAGRDRVHGGVDNDTILGNEGNDVLEGGDGSDVAIGGEGDDILTDSAGDDVPKGGPGHDAIEAGPGLDIILGGTGKDFTNGGANDNETFGGDGDDMIIAGTGNDHVFGDSGSDWIQGGDGVELLCGDSCAPFFDDPNQPGDDILIGQNGDEDYDAEGGNDVMAAGPGIERNAGAAGFDWATYQYDPLPADADLSLSLVGVPLPAVVFRDRYAEVEALSGSARDDVLRGDDLVPTDVGGAGFSGCNALDAAGVSRIDGLAEIVPALTTPRADVADASGTGNCAELTGSVWGAGNLLLGGAGSDLLEGRGADDVLDGDRELVVRLSVRTNEADPASEIGTATLMEGTYQPGNPRTLQQDVFAGLVNPGNIVAVREIRSTPGPSDVDTALFSGPRADYDVAAVDGVLTVAHARGTGLDGTDTLRNVERLQFADVTLEVAAPLAPSIGSATAGDASATVTFTPTAGGPAVQGFLVQPVDPATGTSVGTASPAPAGATSLVVTGLVNGVDIAFRVAGTNDFGTGAFSALSNTVQPAGQAPPPPTDGPTVTPLTPPDGATGVALDANVRAVFSEPVAGLSTGRRSTNVVLVDAAGTREDVRVNYAVAARRVTINPIGDLRPDTTYTATVHGDADPGLRSAATGAPVVTTSWSFTTAAGPAANPAPTIVSSSPAPDATGVFLGANVLVNFSEQVVGVDGTSVQLQRASDGSVVPAAVAYRRFNRRAVLNPDARLDRRAVYRVVVTGGPGVIRDGAGNPLVSTSWTFTTR